MASSRNLRLPSKKYSTRELESIRGKIEEGAFETDRQFSSIIKAILSRDSAEFKSDTELIIRAHDYIAKDFSTVVSVGVSFVPARSESSSEVLRTILNFAKSSGLDSLLRDVNVNDLSTQTQSG